MKYIYLLIIAIVVLEELKADKKIELPKKPDAQITEKDDTASESASDSEYGNSKGQKAEPEPSKTENRIKTQKQSSIHNQDIKKDTDKNVENKVLEPISVVIENKQLTEKEKYVFQRYDREANAKAFIAYLNKQEISFNVLLENKTGYSNVLFMFEDEQDKKQKLKELEKITGMQFNIETQKFGDNIYVDIVAKPAESGNKGVPGFQAGFSLKAENTLTDMLNKKNWDEYLQGTKYYSVKMNDKDSIADFLAYKLVCILQDIYYNRRDSGFYIDSDKLGTYEKQIYENHLIPYLTQYHLPIVDNAQKASHIIEPNTGESNEIGSLWVRVKEKNTGRYLKSGA